MGKLLRLTMALATVGWAQGALACNSSDMSVSFSPATPSIPSWNPFPAGTAQTVTSTITLTRPAGTNAIRTAHIILVDSNASTTLRVGQNGAFAGPIYNITTTSGGATVSFPSGTTATNTIGASFAFASSSSSPSSSSATVTITVPANTAASDFTSGIYSENLTYSLQCYVSNGNVEGNTTGTGPTVNVTVPNLLTVVTAGPQTVNFGSFTTTSQNLAISLKSTGAINASISSANGNKMVLAGAVAPPNTPTNSMIAYTMTFDSQTVPSGGTTLTNLARSGVGGSSKSLVLTLPGLPTGKLAGTYSDTITITLTAGS